MSFLIANWYIGVAMAAVLFCVCLAFYLFVKLPSNKQLDKVREWLLHSVVEAEILLGSKTGKIKLSYVYDAFVARFKWLSIMISFEKFSELVGEALETMKEMLKDSKEVRKLIEGSISSDKENETNRGNKKGMFL